MTVKQAGAARYRYRALRSRRRLVGMASIVALVVVVGFVAYSALESKYAKKVSPHITAVPLSFGVRQAADVNLVAGAIGQYVAANDALPERLSSTTGGGLILCGVSCDAVTNTVSGLSAYQPTDIRLMNYVPNLVAPNQQIMYLVPGAKCRSNGSLGDPNPTPHSMVILYVAETGSTTTPQCLVL